MRSGAKINNFRKFNVPFAAQMFGSGKTTLADHFISRLSDEATATFVGRCVENRTEDYKAAFLREFDHAKKATQLFVDLRNAQDLAAAVFRVARKVRKRAPGCNSESMALLIYKFARNLSAPLFVHFDEVGDLPEAPLRALRDAVVNCWMLMNEEAARGGNPPRIYFFISGKGIPLLALGSTTSAVGTKWIILDKLHVEHISTIRTQLLKGIKADNSLDTELLTWTGGAPRLLVYTLRFLYHAHRDRDVNLLSEEGVAEAMKAAFDRLSRIDVVARDIFFDKRQQGLEEAWLYLLILAQLKVKCTRDMLVAVTNGTFQMEMLLRSLNVYIVPVGGDNAAGEFFVEVMEFIAQYVRLKFANDNQVPLFFGDSTCPGIKAEEVLERLVEHRIIAGLCLGPKAQTWKQLARPLLDDISFCDSPVCIDRARPMSRMPKFGGNNITPLPANISENDMLNMSVINPSDLTRVMTEIMLSPRIYRPGDKSKSADTFIKQPDFLLEIQDKSGIADGLQFAQICKDMGKSLQRGNVVLLFIAIKLGTEVAGWAGKGVLTLKPGVYRRGADGHPKGRWPAPVGGQD